MLYWTIIFIAPTYFFCGLWAFYSFFHRHPVHLLRSAGPQEAQRKRRGRRLIGIASLILFTLYGVGSSVIVSLVIGYGLSLLYSVAGIKMSTWVPFLWGLIVGLVNILRKVVNCHVYGDPC